ncbi:MAG: hypothetical protein Fur0023_04980 [Bacteroidia bacterium]
MKSYAKSNEIPVSILVFLYLLSVGLVWINRHFHLSDTELYQHSFLSINIIVAKIINAVLVIANAIFIRKIFTRRNRNISGSYGMFVYLLINNKWWIFETINNYLISDLFILIPLYLIAHQEKKKKINLMVFYLSALFGVGFLSGIHIIYSFFIPIFIFTLFLSWDWKSWIIFLLGFLCPIYFFVTIVWLTDKLPLLFLKALVEHNSYPLHSFSSDIFSYLIKLPVTNTGISIIIILAFLSGLKELNSVYYYSATERRIALFFFLLMLFSFINYALIYVFYRKHTFAVIALPYSYYIGNLLNKSSFKIRYIVLFLIFLLTSFL